VTQPTQLVQGVDELAEAVRRLVDATVRTTADAATLRELTQTVDRVTETLQRQVRTGRWVPDRSDPQASPYNTVVGSGNPLAAPVVLTRRDTDGVTATVRFALPYEGAPGLVHGGILSLVMDQMFGEAAIAAQVAGMTVGLQLRYAAPTPILTDLVFEAHVESADDRLVQLVGSVQADGVTTVTATATFFRLTEKHAARMFPHLAKA
jgi:acyl-coenzyme A thioesterase PaaI-like protein